EENGTLQLERLPERRKEKKKGLIQNPVLDRMQKLLGKYSASYSYLKPYLRRALLSYRARKNPPQPPEGEALQKRLDLTRALIAEIGEISGESGADLVVVGIPERGEIDPEHPQRLLPEDGRPYWKAQRRMLQGIANDTENIEFLPLKPVYRDEHRTGNQLYGTFDHHTNEYGHRVTARALYRHLSGGRYIPDTDINFSRDYGSPPARCP
ncbi:MAG: hypothetical protein SVW02_02380, partial [Candidatus Nanohaloarchaea archaeon]|nr:hypothetical protein [Candidatus Nanohaloarchaea archaeon]